jgi:hypothetical protein
MEQKTQTESFVTLVRKIMAFNYLIGYTPTSLSSLYF